MVALTATATPKVMRDVCKYLGISATSGVNVGVCRNGNLNIEVDAVDEASRHKALLNLLGHNGELSGKGKACPVIVYARTKHETEVIAELLREHDIDAKHFHGGTRISERKVVQDRFMSGTLRVVVATVAFGLGLNKPNVRGVIHCGMPRSVEAYVQEMGRAGRDGDPSLCVTLFSPDESARNLSLTQSDGVDVSQIRAFLLWLAERATASGSDTATVPAATVAAKFDLKEGMMETLLVYLAEMGAVELMSPRHASARIEFVGRATGRELSRTCPAIAAVLRVAKLREQQLEFCPSDAGDVIHELRRLQNENKIKLDLFDLSTCVRVIDTFSSSNCLEKRAMELHARASALQDIAVSKVHAIHVLMSHAVASHKKMISRDEVAKSIRENIPKLTFRPVLQTTARVRERRMQSPYLARGSRARILP